MPESMKCQQIPKLYSANRKVKWDIKATEAKCFLVWSIRNPKHVISIANLPSRNMKNLKIVHDYGNEGL